MPTAPLAPPRPSLESPRLRAELAIASLLILVAVNLLDIVNSSLDLAVFGGHLGPGIRGTHFLWSEGRNTLIGVSWLLIAFPASVITISVWVYRAYRNLAALGEPARMSPAMAVAWFFIPVANLWKPYQVMAEIWRKSLQRPAGALFYVWWTCWLVGSLAGIVQMQFSLREPSEPASRTLPLVLSFPADLLYIAAALLLIRIIASVTSAQEQAAKSDALGDRDAAAGK